MIRAPLFSFLLCLTSLLGVGHLPRLAADDTTTATVADPVPAPTTATDHSIQDQLGDWEPIWYDKNEQTWRRVAVRKAETPKEESRPPRADWMPADTVGWILVGLVVTIVVVALILAIRSWIALQGSGALDGQEIRRTPARASARLQYLPFQVDIAANPQAELDKALANGDWNKAIIWSYVKLLLTLEESGLLHLRPGATDRGCLQQVQTNVQALNRPIEIVGILKDIILLFQRSYFGHQDADQQMAKQATHGLEQLHTLLSQRKPTSRSRRLAS